jgi:phosphatidate phosphatase APP1
LLDIDDTIKITTTSDPIGILKETFINPPSPVPGMPELYAGIKSFLPHNTPWFYLSASPYNLYPFLKGFRDTYYPPGTFILRDSSWKTVSGLLSSLTMGTEEYKVDRMKKINSWLPKRKLIVFGDSTQSDPEAYGEM